MILATEDQLFQAVKSFSYTRASNLHLVLEPFAKEILKRIMDKNLVLENIKKFLQGDTRKGAMLFHQETPWGWTIREKNSPPVHIVNYSTGCMQTIFLLQENRLQQNSVIVATEKEYLPCLLRLVEPETRKKLPAISA